MHSPLVGPLTWSRVATTLQDQGFDAVVPVLHDAPDSGLPFWQQHAGAVAHDLTAVPADRELVLVGHSGAGALLPVIAHAARRPIGAYLFVDAGLPRDGLSRLAAMEDEAPAFAHELRHHLANGGRFPEWTAEDLRALIPDERVRRGLMAELHPRDRAFFDEPVPGFASGPAAPCGYFLFSAPYREVAAQAQARGWAYRHIEAGHFHMVVEPEEVAVTLIDLVHQLQEPKAALSSGLRPTRRSRSVV